MTEIRNIIHRLRLRQSIRHIHRELGAHRSIIRELYALAVMHQWLDSTLPMPSDAEIAQAQQQPAIYQSHPLALYHEQLKNWDKERLSSIVIQQLLHDRYPCQQDDLYQLIAARYEKHSTIITSNRDFGEWSGIFTNALLGSAALDRLVHKGIQIVIEGKSYRLAEFKKSCSEKMDKA